LLVEVLVLQGVNLFLDEEDLDELGKFAFEGVEVGEDRVDVFLEEVEVRVVAHLVVACVALELVVLSVVQRDALAEHLNEVLDGLLLPEVGAVPCFRVDEVLAASDHLVGQLAEELEDVLFVQVVLVDVVDHADGVEQERQLLFDHGGPRLFEFLDLPLELHEVLVVVLGFGQLAVEFVLEFLVVLLLGFEVWLELLDSLLDFVELFVFARRGVLRQRTGKRDEELEHVVDQFVCSRTELLVD